MKPKSKTAKKWTFASDKAADKKAGIKPGSKRDLLLDYKRGLISSPTTTAHQLSSKSTPKVGQKVTLKKTKPGQKTITFKKGGLHSSLGVPQGSKIPASKMAAARAGKYGPKAKAQANFAKNVLTGKK